jgi:hypothetical protein
VFRKETKLSHFGIASADFVLAEEVNLGDYRINATLGEVSAEKTVGVQRYLLPKFRTELKTSRKFYLPGETIKGDLQIDYFFGKPVAGGQVQVIASTFDVAFKEFARWGGKTDANGHASFALRLPAALVGLPLHKGDGLVRLEVKATDAAGHVETISRTCPVSRQPIKISLLPEAGRLVPGLENRIFVATVYPDGSPAQTSVSVWLGREAKGSPLASVKTNEVGLAEVRIVPRAEQFRQAGWVNRRVEMLGGVVDMGEMPNLLLDLTAQASDTRGNQVISTAQLSSDSVADQVLLRLDKAIYQGGESIQVDIRTTAGLPTVSLDVTREGQLLSSRPLAVREGQARCQVDLPPDTFGTLEVHAYQVLRSGEIVRDSRVVYVSPARELRVQVRADQPVHAPGSEGVIHFAVTDRDGKPAPAALGVLIVDEAVYALQEMQPGLEKVFFTLQKELLSPRAEVVYRPGEKLDTLVRRPVVSGRQQQAAQVLLSAVRARPPVHWAIDPAATRWQQQQQQTRTISEEIFWQAQDGKPVLVRDEKTGAVRFRKELLSELVQARPVKRRFLTDPFGRELTLADLLAREPGFTPERLARAVTEVRLFHMTWAIELHARNHRARYFSGDRFIPTRAILGEALRALDWPTHWGRDAWGHPFLLVRRSDQNTSGLRVQDEFVLVSAGPDGRFGTTDDLVCGSIHEGERAASWFREEDRRWARNQAWPLPVMVANRFRGMQAGFGGGLGGLGALGGGLGALGGGLGALGGQVGGAQIGWFGAHGGGMPAGRIAPPEGLVDRGVKADRTPAPPRLREYFPETLLWQPALLTDEQGQATLKVPFADSITTWRLSASASSQVGALGGASIPVRVFQDFFVDVDLPAALTQNDEVAFPVAVFNYLKEKQTLTLELQPAPWFELTDGLGFRRTLDLEAGKVTAVSFRIKVRKVGHFSLTLHARGSKKSDAVKRSVEVLPDGVLVEQVATDRLKGTINHTLPLPEDAIEGTPRLLVKVYPGVASQLLEGAEGMLKIPHGCFEQTSSSAYPNVLVVDLLRRSGSASPTLLLKAEEYLNAGYQRLLTFERPGGGFDLWGTGKPELWLSAYGLMEFTDMAKVWPVDPRILERTRAWLLKRQEADGTWSKPDGTRLVVTSYVTWALAEHLSQTNGWREDYDHARLRKAIEYIRTEAVRSDNAYALALAANALASWDPKDEKTREVCTLLLRKLEALKKDHREWKASFYPAEGHTLTSAWGDALSVETTALAVLAMIRTGQFASSANRGLTYLIKTRRADGTWGSTQGTVLALKALTAASMTHKGTTRFTITVNGKEAAQGEVHEKNADVLQLFDLTAHLKTGANQVTLSVRGETGLMYQVVGQHFVPRKKEPPDPVRPLLEVAVEYDRTQLTTADLLRARATLRYHGKEPAYQVIVDLPIAPGFVVDPGEFAQMVAHRKVQRFSMTARQVTLYLGDVKPGDVKTFAYGLRPKYPLRVQAPGAVAYEYYTPGNRSATRPVDLVVEEKK